MRSNIPSSPSPGRRAAPWLLAHAIAAGVVVSAAPGVAAALALAWRARSPDMAWVALREGASHGSVALALLGIAACLLLLTASVASRRVDGAAVEAERFVSSVEPCSAVVGTAVATRRPMPRAAAERSARRQDGELDITLSENLRLRGDNEQLTLQLDEARSAQSRFVSRISHGLRTPMNGILGMSDLLLDGSLDDGQRRFVQSIVASSTGLLGVIDDLLDFARLETGQLRLERARFELRDAVEDACALHAPAAHARDIELACYVDDDVPAIVDGDGKRLRQVISTLIGNALEHTETGEIVVRVVRETNAGGERSAESARTRYRCDVQDTGRGIAPEHQLALWRAFSGATAPDEVSGLGLAMTVASALVQRMEGDISVRSRLGEGSRFSVRFELGDVEAGVDRADSRARLRGRRMLVVDDNRTNRTILEHQLASWGVSAECVDSGAAALDALAAAVARREPFDACVLDLNMPVMDGIDFARALKGDPQLPALPLLMLTSSEIGLETAELDELGILRNLSKPARQSALRDTLASLLTQAADGATVSPIDEARSLSIAPGGVLDAATITALLEEQCAGKPELFARIVTGWQKRTPTLLAALRDGASEAQADALRGLSTSAATLGATEVVECCRTIQDEADAGRRPGDDALASLVDACERLQPELDALVARAA